jgi:hypothetical protein
MACDALQNCAVCTTSVTFTNEAPTCVCDPSVPKVAKGESITTTDCVGDAVDCDPFTWYAVSVDRPIGVGGSWSVDMNTGHLTYNSAATDSGRYCFTLGVTDGVDSSECVKCIEVVSVLKWDVVIENKTNVMLGSIDSLGVYIAQGTERMGGYDMLIAYDASALIFIKATEGDLHIDCEWEYFTYRYGPFGNCGNQCPSGMVRVIGMAELNNGPFHPICFRLDPVAYGGCYSLFFLHFVVTNDYTLECNVLPVRFFWYDCGDNTISSKDGDTLWVSRNVYNKGGGPQSGGIFPPLVPGMCPNEDYDYYEITNDTVGFPTFMGVQEECFGQPPKTPIDFINFYNGGMDLVCIDTLDDRGDINLNDVANEIADAVMFTNYFIYGLGVFKINQPAQIAATDVNADGLTLSVGDLVYLTRILSGDAQPYNKLSPMATTYTVDNGVVSVEGRMGAAYVVFQGDVTPTLLAEQMELKYAYNTEENVTRALVYSLEGHGFSGDFLSANGNIVSIEMGSYEGAVVKLEQLPVDFALNQNYPNPFNPVTTVSFNLPVATDYTLTIYNVTGQQVTEFAGSADAGVVSVDVDASSWASGVYFYRLTAGDFSDTKKMVLLK